MKKNFYFTFGSAETFPYSRGQFVMVKAENMKDAAEKFKAKYPCRIPGILNCASYYPENVFNEFRDEYYKGVEPAEVIE